ncbi:hypothetical protein QTP70_010735 [Hemibagrus guttatus]|uniref:Uncharacterized protein n=1 Tax=Hemibagrus guttatus TaxID=175788 RepID=A0AAE0QAL4_9TELE|nr:hypothetical protein QTP70_010735 [Hemibagrus guttatus]
MKALGYHLHQREKLKQDTRRSEFTPVSFPLADLHLAQPCRRTRKAEERRTGLNERRAFFKSAMRQISDSSLHS